MFKHILIPTDGSRLSRKAVEAGIRFAKDEGARVTGFFAAPAPTPIIYKDYLPVGYHSEIESERLIERSAAHYLSVIENAAAKAGVQCEVLHVTDDFPAEAILAVAKKKKCDCIFMASHGRKGLAGILLGSQTLKVVQHSPIPVVVYRSSE